MLAGLITRRPEVQILLPQLFHEQGLNIGSLSVVETVLPPLLRHREAAKLDHGGYMLRGPHPNNLGLVAHLGERPPRTGKVAGSTPAESTT